MQRVHVHTSKSSKFAYKFYIIIIAYRFYIQILLTNDYIRMVYGAGTVPRAGLAHDEPKAETTIRGVSPAKRQ